MQPFRIRASRQAPAKPKTDPYKLQASGNGRSFHTNRHMINLALSLVMIGGFVIGGTTLLLKGKAAAPVPADDTTPPVAQIIQPTSTTPLNGNVIIQASASDDTSVTKLEIVIDGKLVRTVNHKSSVQFAWSTDEITPGNHTIHVTAYDPSGKSGTTSLTVTK